MYNSKLIHILQVLNTEEREALKKWLYSPVHNQRQDRLQLLLYLLSKRKLTPRTTAVLPAYQQVYGVVPYEDKKWKRLMNLCVQLLEDFIHFLVQKREAFSKQKALISFFQQHKLHKYTQQYLKKAQAQQAQITAHNSLYFQQQLELENWYFEYQNSTTGNKTTNLQALFDNSYLAFMLQTLHYACAAITHQRLYNSTYTIPLLEPILTAIGQGEYQAVPSVQLYYHALMALREPSQESYFETLQQLLSQHYEALPPKEIKGLYVIAINYCVQQLNNGIEKYVRAVFDLYQYGLEHSILVEQAILSRFTYKNIVAAGIRLQEYDWVIQFIETYTPLLEVDYQKTYSLYAKAKLHFAQEKFDHTLSLLTQVEFDNLFLNMDAKTMLLKIYYEKGDFEALDSLLISFQKFLQRKSIVAYQQQIHKNMIKLTKKLIYLPLLPDKAVLQELKQEILATNPLTEKPWLLAQLEKF